MLYSEATTVEWLSPCTHEKANTRMLFHAADGVKQGRQKIVIRTVDTDVVVLAVSFARRLCCESSDRYREIIPIRRRNCYCTRA